MKNLIGAGIAFIFLLVVYIVFKASFMSATGYAAHLINRHGIYAVCRPEGYDVVCFVNADSDSHSPSCIALSQDSPCK